MAETAKEKTTKDKAASFSKSNSLKAQSTKFLITGGIAAVIDLALTWVFQIALGMFGDAGSRTIGFAVGTLTAYLLNRRWTFNAQPSLARFAAVATTYGLTYVVNILMYRWGYHFLDGSLGWDKNVALAVAFLVAQGAATAINFLVQRWIIFRSARKKGPRYVQNTEPS